MKDWNVFNAKAQGRGDAKVNKIAWRPGGLASKMPSAGMLMFLAVLLLITSATLAHAHPSTSLRMGYDVSWFTVAGGGGASQGGDYAVMDTLGQSDAHEWSSGGPYSVMGGFWGGGSEVYTVFLPLVLK